MSEQIDTDAVRRKTSRGRSLPSSEARALCDEIDRLRAENATLRQVAPVWDDELGWTSLAAMHVLRGEHGA